MIPIVYITSNSENAYEDGTFWGSVKDRFKILNDGLVYIDDLKLQIAKTIMPPNFHEKAYLKNISMASKRSKFEDVVLAPKTNRLMDFKLFTGFQKNFCAYSVVKSMELMLRLRKKSIKNSCIVVYDASDAIMREVIFETAKKAEYIICVSNNITNLRKLQDCVVTEFGVSPIITPDLNFAIKCSDFIVCSRKYTFNCKSPVWYMDNNYIPEQTGLDYANDVVYKTPWDSGEISMAPELLGAILYQMQGKDIEESLKYNGIYLNEIRFNDFTL